MSKCSVVNCEEVQTVRCGTWGFCTFHAIGMAQVTLDEDGWGMGLWGTARADDPDVIAEIRRANGVMDEESHVD